MVFVKKLRSLLKLFLFLQNKFLFGDILGSEKAILCKTMVVFWIVEKIYIFRGGYPIVFN